MELLTGSAFPDVYLYIFMTSLFASFTSALTEFDLKIHLEEHTVLNVAVLPFSTMF